LDKEELRERLLEARQQYIDKNAKRLGQIRPKWEAVQAIVPDVEKIQPYIEFCETKDLNDLWWYGRVTVSSAPLCYDEETDILTELGWMRFCDLIPSVKVATLNRETNKLEYQLPTHYVNEHYSGKMFKQSGSIDLLVTPNHNLFISRDKHLDFNLIRADESTRCVRYTSKFDWCGNHIDYFTLPKVDHIPKGKHYDDVVLDINTFVSILGFYLAEGHTTKYSVCFTQNTGDKLDTFLDVLDKAGIKYSLQKKSTKSRRIVLGNKVWAAYFNKLGKRDSKYIPTCIKGLPKKQLRLLLDFAMLGDGCNRDRNDGSRERTYSTISKRLADDISEICLKLGYNTKLRSYINSVGNKAYIVTFNPTYNTYNPNSHKDKRSWVDYDGKIYCVTVPNQIIMVRRNGKPVWCGNSGEVGRRIHYLVRDRETGFIIGIVGLASDLTIPIRDKFIGWTHQNKWKGKRINYLMNVQHCISTPEFGNYLAGKLCALSTKSKEVQDYFENKYGHRLAMMTVTSLYGKSSLYNRLDGFIYLGTSKGYSSVLVPLEVKQQMREDFKKTKGKHSEIYYNEDGSIKEKYGVVKGYQKLSKYWKVQSIENFRGVYVIPLAKNYREFLREETDTLDLTNYKEFDIIVEEWRERWCLPRIQRIKDGLV